MLPGEILAETLSLIQYRFDFKLAVRAGAFLRGLPHMDITPSTTSTLEKAWAIFQGAGGSLSYPDAVVVAACRGLGADPLAFDTALTQAV